MASTSSPKTADGDGATLTASARSGNPAARRQRLVLAAILWILAAALLQFDRANGPGQQRITVRWAEGLSQESRRAQERTHGLLDGEETEPGRFVYRLEDRSAAVIRRLVGDPRVVDTAHIDRDRFRVTIDAPGMPRILRDALETGLLRGLALGLLVAGLAAGWLARRDLASALVPAITGPSHFPRAQRAQPAWTVPVLSSLAVGARRVEEDWDWWAWRVYRPIVGLVLAAMLAFTAWHGYRLAEDWDGWTIGDWLINYGGGFVRRGLGGELLLALSGVSGISVNRMAWASFVVAFATFAVGFFVLLGTRRLTFWYLALCLSPAFVTFTFHNPDTVGRKDVLVLAALTTWGLLQRKGPRSLSVAAAAALAGGVLTLLHELFAFYAPYFVLLSYAADPEPRTGRWRRALLIPVTSGLVLVVIATWSGSLSDPAVCQRLTTSGAPDTVCEGVLSYGRESAIASLNTFSGTIDEGTRSALVGAAALTVVPAAFFLLLGAPTGRKAVILGAGVLIATLATLPLFVLAVDWGRWLAMHAALLMVVATTVLPAGDSRPYRPTAGLRPVVSIALGLAVVLSMFTWEIRHCCQDTLVQRFAPAAAMRSLADDLGF